VACQAESTGINNYLEYVLTTKSSQSPGTISIKDALDIQNAAFMVPRAMTTIVQEGIEPMLIGTHLLQRIQYKSGMRCR
jgi:hypothetical protein